MSSPLSDSLSTVSGMGTQRTHIVWDWNGTLLPRHRRGDRGDERGVRRDRPSADHPGALPRAVLRAGPAVLRAAAWAGCRPTPSGRVMDETFHRHYRALAVSALRAAPRVRTSCSPGGRRRARPSRCARSPRTRVCCRWCVRTASSTTSCGWTAAPGAATRARPSSWCAIWRRSTGSRRVGSW